MTFRQVLISIVLIPTLLWVPQPVSSKSFSDKKPAKIILGDEHKLGPLISPDIIIDNVNNGIVSVYISPERFSTLQKKGYHINWLPVSPDAVFDRPDNKAARAAKSSELFYPTYTELTDEVQNIAASNPSICSLINGGTSVMGKTLWWIKLSDNVDSSEFEPEVHFIGGVHGDEPVGVTLTLELVRYLITNYPADSRVSNIIESTEIWIMPLMNPDGYMAGERWNANGQDLNRSFPVVDADYPESMTVTAGKEPEIEAVMSWSLGRRSVLSANFHTGALVVNYPFDYTYEPSPDDDLFEYISLQYAAGNTPMYHSTTPSTAVNGTVRGALWYLIEGGMQDWAYLTTGTNQVTIELSVEKSPQTSALRPLWDDNRESMLTFLETVHCGVKGVVTDFYSEEPVNASIQITGTEQRIYTDPYLGDYHRMLLPGSYSLSFKANGYITQTQTVTVESSSVSSLDVKLVPDASSESGIGCFIIAAEK